MPATSPDMTAPLAVRSVGHPSRRNPSSDHARSNEVPPGAGDLRRGARLCSRIPFQSGLPIQGGQGWSIGSGPRGLPASPPPDSPPASPSTKRRRSSYLHCRGRCPKRCPTGDRFPDTPVAEENRQTPPGALPLLLSQESPGSAALSAAAARYHQTRILHRSQHSRPEAQRRSLTLQKLFRHPKVTIPVSRAGNVLTPTSMPHGS